MFTLVNFVAIFTLIPSHFSVIMMRRALADLLRILHE